MAVNLPQGYRAVTPPPREVDPAALPINSKLQYIFEKTMGALKEPQELEVQRRLFTQLIDITEREPRLAYKFEPKHYEALKEFPDLLERLDRI